MYLVPIAWLYVVVMMAAAEALAPNGTLLGAFVTLLLYGLLPLSVVMYIMGTPARRRARLRAEALADAAAPAGADRADDAVPDAAAVPSGAPSSEPSGAPPHGGSQPAGTDIAAVRKEA